MGHSNGALFLALSQRALDHARRPPRRRRRMPLPLLMTLARAARRR